MSVHARMIVCVCVHCCRQGVQYSEHLDELKVQRYGCDIITSIKANNNRKIDRIIILWYHSSFYLCSVSPEVCINFTV